MPKLAGLDIVPVVEHLMLLAEDQRTDEVSVETFGGIDESTLPPNNGITQWNSWSLDVSGFVRNL